MCIPLRIFISTHLKYPPLSDSHPPAGKRLAGGTEGRTMYLALMRRYRCRQERIKDSMERRKLVPMNWDELQAAALAERQDPKWERKWHAVRAWLLYGGKVSLKRWVNREDTETYLRLKDGKVVLVHWDGTWQKFSTLDGLSKYDEYVLIPYDHVGFEKVHQGRLKKSV